MFNFLEKLKKVVIFKKFFSENKKTINTFNNCNFTIISENKSSNKEPIYYDSDKKQIILNDSLLGQHDDEVWKAISEFAQQKGNRLIENKTENYLEKLKNYNPSENNAIIEFFKRIINPEDHKILRAAQFIIQQENIDIHYLKKGIRNRFGDKGNRIVNLLSAGYFSFLKELYNIDTSLFQEIYNQLVTEDVLTIFVHNDIDIMTELELKIKKFKMYKLKLGFIHIHGIGKNNTNKIKKFVDENSENKKFVIKNKIEKDKVFIVEIYPN